MFDWFDSGIFGGLFGSSIIRFLRRFKLRAIFIVSALMTEVGMFLVGVNRVGWQLAWQKMIEKALTPIGLLLPLGMGILCVIVLIVCAPGIIGKPKREK